MLARARAGIRRLMLYWGRTGRAPGWYFQAIERWGLLSENGPLPHRLINGCTIRCDLRQYIDRHIFFLGLYEPVELFLITQLLEPGATVVDGGANIGLYSIMMSTSVGPSGSVHAFEPIPGTHGRLVENVGLNHLTNVTVSNFGLTDQTGVTTLGLAADKIDNVGAFGVGHDAPQQFVDISTITLDEYVAAHSIASLAFVKLDIEGSELRALKGARSVLARDEPTLLVEIDQETAVRGGYAPGEILDLLGPLGYRAFVIRESSDDSGYVDALDEIPHANVLFHTGPTPPVLERRWTLKEVLRWARG